MKVLFISSGNSKHGISPIIKAQGESLKKNGIDVEYFLIKGKGLKGYLKNIKMIRDFCKKNEFDLFHAHYSFSAYLASLANLKPLIVSLMGSDVKSGALNKFINYFFEKFFWQKVIVKSIDMQNDLFGRYSIVIPNGVDLNHFKPIEKDDAMDQIGWNKSKKHILFPSNPNRKEKNYKLAKSAFESLQDPSLEIHYLKNVTYDKMPIYYNASDIVLLTSLWEGSPNAIKEAMACNKPIISTMVGDVEFLLDKVEGSFVVNDNIKDIADKIKLVISNYSFTNGRDKIELLNLDSTNIARKIKHIYSKELVN